MRPLTRPSVLRERLMKLKVLQIVTSIALAGLCACAGILPAIQNPFENKDGNVVLYVSNQSLEIKTVDILVVVDDKPVLHEYFKVGNQHVWKPFHLQLSDGMHRIRAVTHKGHTQIEDSFEVAERRWLTISYGRMKHEGQKHDRPTFNFSVSDRPVGSL